MATNLFVEYDWTSQVWRFRFAAIFTDLRGERSWSTKAEMVDALGRAGFKLGSKTDTRTFEVLLVRESNQPRTQSGKPGCC